MPKRGTWSWQSMWKDKGLVTAQDRSGLPSKYDETDRGKVRGLRGQKKKTKKKKKIETALMRKNPVAVFWDIVVQFHLLSSAANKPFQSHYLFFICVIKPNNFWFIKHWNAWLHCSHDNLIPPCLTLHALECLYLLHVSECNSNMWVLSWPRPNWAVGGRRVKPRLFPYSWTKLHSSSCSKGVKLIQTKGIKLGDGTWLHQSSLVA